MKRGKVVLLVAAVFLSGPAAGGTMSRFGSEKPVTMEDFRPHLMDGEGYTEEWSHGVWTEDGKWTIGVDFYISNLGIGDHKGGFRARFRDAAGKVTKCSAKYDDDEWSSAKSGFALKFGKAQVQGDMQGLKVKVKCKKLVLDLDFQNEVPPLKPGGGKLRFGEGEGVYSMVFTSPRAKVTGTMVAAGKSRQIKGVGYATHSYSSMYPHKQSRRWFRFKTINKDISIITAEVESVADYHNATNGWVLVLDPKGRIAATARTNFIFDGFIQDSKSDEGYKIPRRVRIIAVDGKTQITGLLLMKDIKKVRDPTADMDAIQRTIVRRFTKPRDYYINCSYKIRIKTEEGSRTVEDEGVYRFIYVNP
jgi:hypothetical protein